MIETFLKEMLKICGFNKYDNPCIDGLKDNERITNQFASQYNKLFNSNHSDANDLINMMNGLNKSIKMDNNSLLDYHISNKHFHKAIKTLKCEKQASENVINATELYYEHLHFLFINCLKHGYMSNAMIVSTLLPITKRQ